MCECGLYNYFLAKKKGRIWLALGEASTPQILRASHAAIPLRFEKFTYRALVFRFLEFCLGWARLLLDRARDLITHGSAHLGANGAALPMDEDDQDSHFSFNHLERKGYFRLGVRASVAAV